MNVNQKLRRLPPICKRLQFLFFLILLSPLALLSQDQTQTISGVITDSKERPLPGANVLIKGTRRGTSTDIDGRFVLNNVAPNAVLVISSQGYAAQEIALRGRGNV